MLNAELSHLALSTYNLSFACIRARKEEDSGMSVPITITDDMKQRAQTEFAEMLAELKMSDGKINYSKSFKYKDASAVLLLTPEAYSKTVALVTAFSDEVAWHGIAARSGKAEFIIEDIMVYPQEVTGSTVNTDQDGYTKWLYEFDDDSFNKIRMQGHSHVNMGVSPSGVDSGHREKILNQLDGDMFYIFMVWNKRLETHTLIYDMARNVLYDDDDVDVKIVGDDSMDVFLADAKEKVQKKKAASYKGKGKRKKAEIAETQSSLWEQFYGYRHYDQYDL